MATSDERGSQAARTGDGQWAKALGDQVWHLVDMDGRVGSPLCGLAQFAPAQRLSRANMAATVPQPAQCQWCRDVAYERATGAAVA
jgi:hypothetical protein